MKRIVKRKCLGAIKPYVPGKPVEEVERELGVKVGAKLASNENTLGPSPLAIKAIQEAAGGAHLYPDGNCHHLRSALAAKLQIEPEQLLIANGSDESLSMIARTFINPGDETVMPAPSFPQYEFATRVMDGVPRIVPLNDDFTYNVRAMLDQVTKRTQILYLCSPNNPTGTILKKAEFEKLLNKLPGHVLVVMDEAYYEYVDEPEYFNTLDYIRSGYPVIALRTFSKIYGLAGLRIGYAVADSNYIKEIMTVREPFNVNRLAQAAATAALEDEQHVQKGMKVAAEGRKMLGRALESLGCVCIPSFANFIFVDFKQPTDRLFQELLKQGIIVRPGGIFGYPTYARITIGTDSENQSFIEALKKVI